MNFVECKYETSGRCKMDLLGNLIHGDFHHVVMAILDKLDLPSLRRCLWVSNTLRRFLLNNVDRLKFEAKERKSNYSQPHKLTLLEVLPPDLPPNSPTWLPTLLDLKIDNVPLLYRTELVEDKVDPWLFNDNYILYNRIEDSKMLLHRYTRTDSGGQLYSGEVELREKLRSCPDSNMHTSGSTVVTMEESEVSSKKGIIFLLWRLNNEATEVVQVMNDKGHPLILKVGDLPLSYGVPLIEEIRLTVKHKKNGNKESVLLHIKYKDVFVLWLVDIIGGVITCQYEYRVPEAYGFHVRNTNRVNMPGTEIAVAWSDWYVAVCIYIFKPGIRPMLTVLHAENGNPLLTDEPDFKISGGMELLANKDTLMLHYQENYGCPYFAYVYKIPKLGQAPNAEHDTRFYKLDSKEMRSDHFARVAKFCDGDILVALCEYYSYKSGSVEECRYVQANAIAVWDLKLAQPEKEEGFTPPVLDPCQVHPLGTKVCITWFYHEWALNSDLFVLYNNSPSKGFERAFLLATLNKSLRLLQMLDGKRFKMLKSEDLAKK